MTPTASIVGGGIGGLTAAVALQQRGWRVTVYERAAGPPTTGTALGLWPAALTALDSIGLGDRARRLGRRQESGAFLRPDGSRIAAIRSGGADAVHLLSRPPLLGLLADALEADTVRWGADVAGPDGLRADVVVGADGLHSQLRARAFGARYHTRYVGATTWRGTVDGDVGSTSETWGEGTRFGITPHEGGRTNWFACARVPAGQRAPGREIPALRARFGHWHPEVRRVLDALTEDTILRHDLYELAPALPSYVSGNLALVGDAAHAMTPDLGRGACEALIDGVTLAECLATGASVPAALRDYDARRRRSTQRLARASRLVNRMAHARRLLPVRDAALRGALAAAPPL